MNSDRAISIWARIVSMADDFSFSLAKRPKIYRWLIKIALGKTALYDLECLLETLKKWRTFNE